MCSASTSEQAARHLRCSLDGLVRIRRCADRNLLARANVAQLLPQQPRGVLLDEDLALKILRVAQLHKLVGIARVAVAAGELAPAIGVDALGKDLPPFRDGVVENGAHRQRPEFDQVAVAHVISLVG